MKYITNLLKSLKEVIITYILQIIVTIITATIYYFFINKNLNKFISLYSPISLIALNIIIIYYFWKKNNIKLKKIKIKESYILISLGISISCILNMIIFLFYTPNITTTVPIYLLLISSCIIGPIYEEIIFRYILLNKLKKFNSPKTSIIISSLIFSILHLNPTKIFFSFILGLILNITYNKTNNIITSIIIHISTNTIALFLTNFNIYILILSILILLINIKYINYKNYSL